VGPFSCLAHWQSFGLRDKHWRNGRMQRNMSTEPERQTAPEVGSESQPEAAAKKLFLPSFRAAIVLALLAMVSVGVALFFRYSIIQNTPIGLACDAGELSLTCKVRLAVILMFVQGAFGWVAMIAAGVQLWKPNIVAFGTGLIFALLGLVLYNTRASALAVALLLLSLARPSAERC
jgi:hypothetical protein